ncbi:MAG: CDP-diacylglycerol--glycerol-3-phosphate 3-phosphatidyltransferase [Thermodesulfobacteriota bacterium]|nr:CDP-diacylglycerol--glycerol-3-phosphate 3-phosphatidyltransferase [Thermodesulfobacteriota bacterium]
MNPANVLTVSRIIMVPIIAVLMCYDSLWPSVIAALFFIAATITDSLDGYIARKYHMESDLGRLLDPLADKLLIATVLIFLIPLERAPAWIVAVIIGREIAVTGLRGLASEKNIIIAANWLGKYKTAFQCAALIPLLLHYTIYDIEFQRAGEYFLWIACFFTIWSGIDYAMSYARGTIHT